MTITDSYSERSYLAGLTSNMDVRAHIGRSNPSPIVASSGQEWQYDISTVRAHIGRSTGRSTPTYSARHHGMYIMGCITAPHCGFLKKVGI